MLRTNGGYSVARAPRLLVATAQGILYVYALDPNEGGECTLLRHHRFLELTPKGGATPDEAPLPAQGECRGHKFTRDPKSRNKLTDASLNHDLYFLVLQCSLKT